MVPYDTIDLNNLPVAHHERIAVRVTRDAERQIKSGHPWLYENSIQSISRDGSPGDLAVVFDHARKFLAIGLYDPHSPLRVRILQHHTPEPINHDWFNLQFNKAVQIRKDIPTLTNGYRLVNGENDRFPGLVIDKYDQLCVLKMYTAAWVPYLRMLVEILNGHNTFNAIIMRLNRQLISNNPFPQLTDGNVLFGNIPLDPFTFMENGLTFEVDPFLGHKTGFYLDQRENRENVEKLCSGKRVLNLFSYTGGFSLYAARGGASEITSIDISQKALDVSTLNFKRNENVPGISSTIHQTICSDAFEALTRFIKTGKRFDVIVIDPPSFAKSMKEKSNALRNYARLTRSGLDLLSRDGYLIQSSCSNKISSDEFYQTVEGIFTEYNADIQIINKTGHPVDHPISFPQGRYLKTIYAKKIINHG